METAITIIIGIIAGAVITFIIIKLTSKNSVKTGEEIAQSVELKIREILPESLKIANEQLVSMANEKLGSEKKEIRTDLENKRSEIERLIKVIQDDLKDSKNNLDKAERDRIGSFSALSKQLEEYKKVTDQLSVSTEKLKSVLSNNPMRGQFGEQVAEDLLKMAGFVNGVDYSKQESGTKGRPDFTVFFPDGAKINVDVKFPYANLQKMSETEDPHEKKKYIDAFKTDIKTKIKEVTTRDYIDPSQKTLDFVVLFIPNEMIFSYIYEKMNDVIVEAINKKVVLAGPFSFTAILRMVKQAYDNFRFQSNLGEIIKQIRTFEVEFHKYSEEFEKIGIKINQLEEQYQKVDSTRTNVLMKTVEKIKLNDGNLDNGELIATANVDVDNNDQQVKMIE